MIDPLRELLGDAGGPGFFDEHWGRTVVHAPGDPARLTAWFDLEHWRARAHLGVVDAAICDAHGRQRQYRIEPAQIDEALARGHTICADVSTAPELAPRLAALRLRTAPSPEPAFAKLYVSPAGAGFAPHFDAHHVLVLQLEGTKRWRTTDAVISAPLHGGKLDADDRPVHTGLRDGDPIEADDGALVVAPAAWRISTLRPGDCLYVPPGAWHATEALEPSIALSVSPPRAPTLRLLLHVLEQELARRPVWREDLVRREIVPGAVPESVASRLATCRRELVELVASLDDATLQRAWALEAFATSVAAPLAPVRGVVGPDDRIEHADPAGFVYVLAPGDDGGEDVVYLYRPGGEWILPRAALAFVVELARVPRFRAAACLGWDPALDWRAAAEVLMQLERAGFLRRGG